MSSAHVDSQAFFSARLLALGLTPFTDKFTRLGFTTLGRLAFSSTFCPGLSDGAVLENDLVVKILGSSEHPDACQIRRLFYEAHTLATADLRRTVERDQDAPPRVLPNEERVSRRTSLASQLTGIKMEGELEPSNRLQDLVQDMHDVNLLQYVGWELCTKRDQEIDGIKVDKSWSFVEGSDGNLKFATSRSSDHPSANLATDLRLRNCLQRRGMAFHMADIMDYHVHEMLIAILLEEYQREPVPGFSSVAWTQLRNADKECFRLLGTLCRPGIRRTVDGVRPLDREMPVVLAKSSFTNRLAGLQIGGGGSKPASSGSGSAQANTKDQARIRQLESENKNLKNKVIKNPWQDKNARKDFKGKDKGKGKGKNAALPSGLIGKHGKTPAGEPICFNYNLNGCDSAKPGERCNRGWHVCMEPRCYKAHSLSAHQ